MNATTDPRPMILPVPNTPEGERAVDHLVSEVMYMSDDLRGTATLKELTATLDAVGYWTFGEYREFSAAIGRFIRDAKHVRDSDRILAVTLAFAEVRRVMGYPQDD